MPNYEIEILHEPTGEYLVFTFDSDNEEYDEEAVLKDLKISFVEPVPYEELHTIDLELDGNK
jgi:hypothetical protein